MGAARLEVVAGKAVGMSILVDDELLVGRNAEGAGRLADDKEISRSHARVSTDTRGLCAIEDLGSTNGTFVNGLRISTPQTLSEGDTIEIGSTTLVLRELPRPDPAPAPASQRVEPTRDTGTGRSEDSPAPAPAVAPAPGSEFLPPTEAMAPPAGPVEVEPPAILSQETPIAAPSQPAPALPPLSLALEVDFDAREARLFLDQTSEPVLLVLDAGTWRAVSSPLTEKGPPA